MDGRPASPASPGPRHWLRRLAWLAAIWMASVATLCMAAFAFRLLMRAAGMSP